MPFPASLTRIDTRAIVCCFALALIAGVWALTLRQLDGAQTSALENTERDARNFARAFSEHTARTVESADQAVTFLRYRYNAAGPSFDIARDLQTGVLESAIYNLFSIVDAHGDVVLSSKPFSPINLADREHFRVHQMGDGDKLYISEPVLGRVSGKWSIQMTRRISAANGAFNGVVVASLDPSYFTHLYQDIDLGAHGSTALIGTDGVIRVRRGGAVDAIGQDVSKAPLFQRMLATGDGVLRATSTLDGRERMFAYHKLAKYRLYVLVGLDLEDRLAPYQTARAQALLLAALCSAIILGFTLLIVLLVGRLIVSRNQAVAANHAKSQFLARVSHELRTPLNGILGYAEALLQELPSVPQRTYASTIHGCGVALLALVDALLKLSEIEAGRSQDLPAAFPLVPLLERTLAAHVPRATAKGLTLTLDAAADLPSDFVCDAAALQQVLAHLLENAIKFTDAGGVRLCVARSGADLLFEVIDSGIGIAAPLQARIFDNFFQADAASTRQRAGLGLGLSISKPLIAAMGGQLQVDSTPGSGSRFWFTLPEAGRAAHHQAPQAHAPSCARAPRRRHDDIAVPAKPMATLIWTQKS